LALVLLVEIQHPQMALTAARAGNKEAVKTDEEESKAVTGTIAVSGSTSDDGRCRHDETATTYTFWRSCTKA